MPFGFGTALGLGAIGSTLANGLFGGSRTNTSSSTVQSSTGNTEGSSVRQYGEQQYNDEILAGLESLLGTQMSSFGTSTAATQARLGQLSQQAQLAPFDVAQYEQQVAGQAAARAGLDLDSSINRLFSATGTSSNDNSMTALLENRMRNDTASNLAGISAGARATGEQIRQSQEAQLTSGIQGLSDSLANQVLSLMTQVRGARTAGTATTNEEVNESTNTRSSTSGSSETPSNPFSAFTDLFAILGNSNASA